jgi:hypothetical protein
VPLRIVVSDASCLIDLRKVSLLEPFLSAHKISAAGMLHTALQAMTKDPTVRLPAHELAAYLKRYAGG